MAKAKYVFLAMGDCSDPAREADLNKWWDEIHIPDILLSPEAIQGFRYVNTDPDGNKRPKYLEIIEVETDDIVKFEKELDARMAKLRSEGRGMSCLMPDRSVPLKRPYYKQLSSIKKATKKT